MYIEDEMSLKMIELNREYLNLYYSTDYQNYLAKKNRILTLRKSIGYIQNGYFQIFIEKIMNKIIVPKESNKNNSFFSTSEEFSEKELSGKRIAVYTCVIDNYDIVKKIFYRSKNCEYFVISDTQIQESFDWKFIDANSYPETISMNATQKNRYFKLHPDLLFSDYDYSIYIDANIQVIGDLLPLVSFMKGKILGIHMHRSRKCIYREAKEVIVLKKANKKSVNYQIKKYKKEGFPKNFGLFEAGILIRDHNNPITKKIMRDWWNEISMYTLRDQLSLPYVLWKNKVDFNDLFIFPCTIPKNPRFRLTEQHELNAQK